MFWSELLPFMIVCNLHWGFRLFLMYEVLYLTLMYTLELNLLCPRLFTRLRLVTACSSHNVLCKMCNIAWSISVSCKTGSPLRVKRYQHVIVIVKWLNFGRNLCHFPYICAPILQFLLLVYPLCIKMPTIIQHLINLNQYFPEPCFSSFECKVLPQEEFWTQCKQHTSTTVTHGIKTLCSVWRVYVKNHFEWCKLARWGTARTLPKFLCCSMYCLFCVILCIVCV
jgi:hypothetical protein